MLSQIRMKLFPFQLLPPSLYVYLNPQLGGSSAHKLSSFQVAFPFSHCFWQPVHVKLHKCFFILGVFVLINLANQYPRCLHPPRDGVTAALGCKGFAVTEQTPALQTQAGQHPCCSPSLCMNLAYLRGLLPEAYLPG